MWAPLILHAYPGYRAEHLLNANLSELMLLLGGLGWVEKWELLKEPMIDKQTRRKLKIPSLVDYHYPRGSER
ncbi:MAG: hypothetical protein DRJ03_20695 [Chloroflexi bacterium]|nr:MAG: hypothetical protein DRJ03_20695 [Chloroflexota bacterium]